MTQDLKLRLVNGALSHLLADALRATLAVPIGTFHTVYLGLIKAAPAFALGVVRTDLTEADYTGYARQLVVWDAPAIDPDGRQYIAGGALDFEPSDGVTPNTVIGAAVYDAATNGNLLGFAILPSAIGLDSATDRVTLVPKLAIPGNAAPDWGIGAALQ